MTKPGSVEPAREASLRAGCICGEAGIRQIETRLTFLEGLVTALTSSYINIYSPWNAKTVCD